MDKKFWKNIIFFGLLIILTFGFLFKGADLHQMVETISKINPIYIVIGILCEFLFLLGEAINIKVLLKNFDQKVSLIRCIKYAFIGFFYSAITPSSSGGQPMQIYHMKKDGIDFSYSTIALLVQLCSFHTITLCYMLFGLIYNFNYLVKNLHYFGILFVIGICVSITLVTVLLSLIFAPKASNVFKKITFKIIDTLKLKKSDNIKKRIDEEIDNYRESANYLKKNKTLFIRILGVTLIQILGFYSVPYVTMRAFGITTFSFLEMLSLQAVLYSSIQIIPLPGSMGANEFASKVLFTPVFGGKLINSATIVNRFMSFYFYVIVGGIVSIVAYVKKDKKEKIDNIKEEN